MRMTVRAMGLAAILLLVLASVEGPAAAQELGQRKESRLCFQAAAVGPVPPTGYILSVTEVQGGALSLVGHLLLPGAPNTGVPVSGAARVRDDGHVEFGVQQRGVQTGFLVNVVLNGRLNAPDFSTGAGVLQIMNIPGAAFVALTPLSCDTPFSDP